MSRASWKSRMAAIPEAPAARQSEAFNDVIPPMASTGMETARQTSASRLRPCGAPHAAFDGWAKTGPKKKIICAFARGGFCSFLRVTGNADQEILALGMCVRKPFCFRQWQTVLAQMHAAGPLREHDVQSIIHQDACCSSVACLRFCGPSQSFTREQAAVSCRKIFLPNLNPIDTCGGGGSDLQQECFLCRSNFDFGEAVPVRHVVQERTTR